MRGKEWRNDRPEAALFRTSILVRWFPVCSSKNENGETMKQFIAYLLAVASMADCACVQAQTVETRIGKLEFERGVPTRESVDKLYDEMDFQRACQAYLWALPAVSFAQSLANAEFLSGAHEDDIVISDGYRAVSAILTANVTTPYVSGALDLAKTGPVVVDVPAGLIAGSAMDFWQRPLTDFGVTGPDMGKGGKYLFVGPGQEAPTVKDATVLHSPTFWVMFFYRTLDPDRMKAEALTKGVHVYPWSERERPPAMRYLTPDPAKLAQVTPMPRGMQFWERLAMVIEHEPVQDRDRFFMAMLRPLGIEKGKPFRPDERQRKLLLEAAFVGEAMAKASSFDKRFAGTRYRPDAHWDYLIMADPAQDLADYSQLDERAAFTYEAIALSKAMVSKTPGVGQAYLGSYRDREGHAFDGARTYRLHVPPNPPAKQFWSVTLYDVDTRAIIQNREEIADRSSRQPGLIKNSDGSVDLYFGPTAPRGYDANWIPTVPGKAWFAYFRLYAPLEAYFDRSWALPDIESVK
jgi:hypothetical protein